MDYTDEEKIVSLYEDGYSVSDIAAIIDCRRDYVYYVLENYKDDMLF